MSQSENHFFERPILNSPYVCPTRHWELDEQGQESSPKLVENSPRLPVLMLGDLRLGCPLDFQVPLQCVSQFG